MNTNTHFTFRSFIEYVLIYIGIGSIFFFFYDGFSDFSMTNFLWNVGYSCTIGFPMQMLAYVYQYINEKRWIDWIERPKRSILISFGIMVVYACIVIAIVQWVWWILAKGLTWEQYFSTPALFLHCFFLFIAVFIITLIFQSMSFFKAYRTAAIEKERLKHQALAMKYEVVQNQISPHFLFNALNTAQSLVDIDGDKTKEYLSQLANFYRSMLSFSEEQLVPLNKELTFVNNYIYLQFIRFGNNLKCSINIDNQSEMYIVPMTLQILLENAIKHNVISINNPLTIEISISEDWLIVSNNLKRKTIDEIHSGTGLKNLSARYEFLTDKKVSINESENQFTVKIPLITDDKISITAEK